VPQLGWDRFAGGVRKNDCSEIKTVNDFSLGRQEVELFPASAGVPLKPSSSVLEFKKDDHAAAAFAEKFSSGKLDQESHTHIAIIDENALSRSCLTRCLSASEPNFLADSYSSVDEWRQASAHGKALIVLLCATGRKATEAAVRRDLDVVVQVAPEARVIMVSDFEDSTEIVASFERGARGFIAMSSNLDVAIAAIRLVRAGGTFVPASGLLLSRAAGTSSTANEADTASRQRQNVFTQRQLEVIDRLRQGESNKLIAYKLNMGECTVKVHVRNIMRKIKARNRTEIAFLTNELF
jgi:DNA-binding NarL/FixJ family response regulator